MSEQMQDLGRNSSCDSPKTKDPQESHICWIPYLLNVCVCQYCAASVLSVLSWQHVKLIKQ